ncbi:MAG: single-stranded-DNA-specific exonuclease RecJ, partial [Limnobacter sp.]|nr:single-stranded-DNA-specific exonuclease RecJ [Limnobacter sp.]
AHTGIYALYLEAGRDARHTNATDLGFVLGPRLNAAGRLADMNLGVQCLLANDLQTASQLARQLGEMNAQRRQIEQDMNKDALADIEQFLQSEPAAGMVVAHESWHQGVVGILASRLKDRLYRPTIAMALAEDGTWRGSGRSIPGIHLRDVLDLVSKRLPEGYMPKFGGHAMAAGLTLRAEGLEPFKQEFAQAVAEFADDAVFTRVVHTDGSFPPDQLHARNVDILAKQVWGQGFAPPLFADEFQVLSHRLLKETHSKFVLQRQGQQFTALHWNSTESLPPRCTVAYRVERDTFTGGDAIQLIIEQVLTDD